MGSSLGHKPAMLKDGSLVSTQTMLGNVGIVS